MNGVSPPGIDVRELTLRFGQQTLFERLSFSIEAGHIVALLGSSGAGKSSLLKVIAGLAQPDAGRVIASDGLPVAGRIAWMGQNDLLYPWLNVIDNVTLGARLRGQKADIVWAEHLLERVGLSGHRQARPSTLSGGMRQRAAIARTLYERQPIVLMDEPFSALDTLTRAKIQALAAELLTDHTVLLITHDPLEACRLSHRLMVLSGRPANISEQMVLAGTPPRAVDDPRLLKSQGELLQRLVGSAP